MSQEKKNYYKVLCKCGHVGRKYYVPILYAVEAYSGKEAALFARQIPRVKHNHKDAILNVSKIEYGEFLLIRENNRNDDYLYCHSRKEQNEKCNLQNRLVIDTHNIKNKYEKCDRETRVKYKLKKYKEYYDTICY